MKRFAALASLIEPLEPRRLLSGQPVDRPSYNTGEGFFAVGGKVYDAYGYEFVMKGPNVAHAWGTPTNGFNYLAVDQVAKTGANAARLVFYKDIGPIDSPGLLWDGSDAPEERKRFVERYLANGIVPIVEDHAATRNENGFQQSDPAALAQIVDHWLDPGNVAWLKQYERYVILNIANEWGPPYLPNGGPDHTWRDSYIAQVERLRSGPDGNPLTSADNVNCLIMIDAGNWGQDYHDLKNDAQAILDADPQHNIVFSVHLYHNWRTEDRAHEAGSISSNFGPWDLATGLSDLATGAQSLPLVVGEWTWEDFYDLETSGAYAAYRSQRVLEICDQLGIGHLAWSWNQSSPVTLNMIAGFAASLTYNSNENLSAWGGTLVNDADHGYKASAKRATVFPLPVLPPNPPSPLPPMPIAPPPTTLLVLEKTTEHIGEGGLGVVRLRLNEQPGSNVTVNLSKISGGTNDPDVNLVTTSLTFTPNNWDDYQPIVLTAAPDADSSRGSAKFQLSASGLLSTDFIVKEIEPPAAPPPENIVTVVTDQDRLYSGSGSATSVTVTSTFPAPPSQSLPTGSFFMRFNLGAITGKIASATLRVYTTNTASSTRRVRVFHALNDTWQEGSIAPINASYPIQPNPLPPGGGFTVPATGGSYLDISYPELSELVRTEHLKDGMVTLALRMVSNSAPFQTREGANPPQLVVTTVEAVAPLVSSSAFLFDDAPQRIRFTFSEDVSASLNASDLILTNTSTNTTIDPATIQLADFDTATNTATFTFPGHPFGALPDGQYSATVLASSVTDAAGNTLAGSHVLGFFFLQGDADHNGVIDFDDYVLTDNGFNNGLGGFSNGDFDYDGDVDFDDFVLLDLAFNTQ